MTNRVWILFVILFAFMPFGLASAQSHQHTIDGEKHACDFYNSPAFKNWIRDRPKSQMSVRPANSASQQIVQRIADSAYVNGGFVVEEDTSIPNARAVASGGKRYIRYNPEFMGKLTREIDDWATWTILAHEVGHHLNYDSNGNVGSTPEIELKADFFAGATIRALGGTLEQAISAYESDYMSEEGSTTHPPKTERIFAVMNGWRKKNKELSAKRTITSTYAPTLIDMLDGKGNASIVDAFTEMVSFDTHIERANSGDGIAAMIVGMGYQEGRLVGKSTSKAISFYLKACDAQIGRACSNLGNLYFDGSGVKKSMSKAAQYYTEACQLNHPFACYREGWIFDHGKSGLTDDARARRVYKKACNASNSKACNNLGYLYLNGQGGERDIAVASQMYQLACARDLGTACWNLAYGYDTGTMSWISPEAAQRYLEAACRNGYKKACDFKLTGERYPGPYSDGNTIVYPPSRKPNKDIIEIPNDRACRLGISSACDDLQRKSEDNLGVTQRKDAVIPALKDPIIPARKTESRITVIPDGYAGETATARVRRLSSNCFDKSDGKSCHVLGADYLIGRNGIGQDKAKAATAFAEACNKIKLGPSCFNLAYMVHRGIATSSTPNAVQKFHQNACNYDSKLCKEDPKNTITTY